MRRDEKEITGRPEIDAVIRTAKVIRLAMSRDNRPYILPLSFGYDGKALYIHTAAEGKKIGYFTANPVVCFEFEGRVELRPHAEKPCKWSFAFESVIGYGTIHELAAPEEKVRGLGWIMRHYSGRDWLLDPAALAKTRVWQIEIESMNGKRSA